jgi:hypothetical protein
MISVLSESEHFKGRFRTVLTLIFLSLFWLWVSLSIKNTAPYSAIIMFSGIGVIVISAFTTDLIAPEISRKIKIILIVMLALKMVASIGYFNHYFVDRSGNEVHISCYGDSIAHHRGAIEFLKIWEGSERQQTNKSSVPSSVAMWGYSGFLALIYLACGIVPEVGIIFNAFMAYLFCLLCYRIFIVSGMSAERSLLGLIIMLLSPGIWMWSSLLYKDSLLCFVVMACALASIRLVAEFKYSRLLGVFLLLVLLLPLRYAYIAPLIVLLFISSIFLSSRSIRKISFNLLLCIGITMTVLAVQVEYNLINFPETPANEAQSFKSKILSTTSAVISTTEYHMSLEPAGGHFMSHGIGSITPNLSNFWYTIPARAVYILMTPMPWFGGNSTHEKFDYVIGHFDSIYNITLLMAFCVILFFVRSAKYKPTGLQIILPIVGLLFFVMPLLLYHPGSRYLSIAIPFILAYTLPALSQKRKVIITVAMSVLFISAVHMAYYISQP